MVVVVAGGLVVVVVAVEVVVVAGGFVVVVPLESRQHWLLQQPNAHSYMSFHWYSVTPLTSAPTHSYIIGFSPERYMQHFRLRVDASQVPQSKSTPESARMLPIISPEMDPSMCRFLPTSSVIM
jgi:hypothetical protein